MKKKAIDPRAGGSPARVLFAASFAIPFVLVLAAYAVCGIAPFGDKLLLFSDSYTQYAYFWGHFRQVLLGQGDAFYNMGMVLGGNQIGIFAYYVASPLNLIFLLFPVEEVPIAMHLIVLIKISLCGLAMAVFFKHTAGLDWRCLLLSTAYALCAYVCAYFWCMMWLDGVILLPLVALGLHNIVNDNKPWLYILSLGAAILTNYYIGFILCIFSVLYWVYAMFVRSGGPRPVKSIWVFSLSSLAAGGLSVCLLLPTVFEMSGGKRVGFMGLLKWYTYSTGLRLLEIVCPSRVAEHDSLVKYALLTILLFGFCAVLALALILRSKKLSARFKLCTAAVFMGLILVYGFIFEPQDPFLQKLLIGNVSFDEMRDGLPLIYSGLLPLVLALLYFTDKAIPCRERAASGAFLVLLLCCMGFYLPNLMWHGFTENNCFNFRYSFVFSFVLICCARRAMDGCRGFKFERWLPGAFFLLIIAALSASAERAPLASAFEYAAIICLCGGLGFLLYRGALDAAVSRPWAAGILAALTLLASAVPFFRNISAFSDHDSFLSMSVYREDTEQTMEASELIKAQSEELYRGGLGSSLNSPFLTGLGGLSHFSSAEQVSVTNFLGSMGAAYTDALASCLSSRSRGLDSFFAVRYLTDTVVGPNEGYISLENGLLENPYALPIAFSADRGVIDSVLSYDLPFENLNTAYQTAMPSVGAKVFIPLLPNTEPEISGLELAADYGYEQTGVEAAFIRYELIADTDDPLYLFLTDGRMNSAQVYVNGEYITSRSSPFDWAPLYLGSFEAGSSVTVELRPEPETESEYLMAGQAVFFTESSSALSMYRAEADRLPCKTVSRTGSRMTTQATVGENDCLLYTIPYDRGWRATIDGEPAQTHSAFGVLLAVDAEPGEHTVELRYTPPGLYAGIGISLFTAAMLTTVALIGRKRRQN